MTTRGVCDFPRSWVILKERLVGHLEVNTTYELQARPEPGPSGGPAPGGLDVRAMMGQLGSHGDTLPRRDAYLGTRADATLAGKELRRNGEVPT